MHPVLAPPSAWLLRVFCHAAAAAPWRACAAPASAPAAQPRPCSLPLSPPPASPTGYLTAYARGNRLGLTPNFPTNWFGYWIVRNGDLYNVLNTPLNIQARAAAARRCLLAGAAHRSAPRHAATDASLGAPAAAVCPPPPQALPRAHSRRHAALPPAAELRQGADTAGVVAVQLQPQQPGLQGQRARDPGLGGAQGAGSITPRAECRPSLPTTSNARCLHACCLAACFGLPARLLSGCLPTMPPPPPARCAAGPAVARRTQALGVRCGPVLHHEERQGLLPGCLPAA